MCADVRCLELSDAARDAMTRYLTENPRTGRPAHDYELGSEHEIELERRAFRTYQA